VMKTSLPCTKNAYYDINTIIDALTRHPLPRFVPLDSAVMVENLTGKFLRNQLFSVDGSYQLHGYCLSSSKSILFCLH